MRLNFWRMLAKRWSLRPGVIACLALCMSATGVSAGFMDGIVMRHHIAMLMKNGKATPLAHPITLTDGSMVQPDGMEL